MRKNKGSKGMKSGNTCILFYEPADIFEDYLWHC